MALWVSILFTYLTEKIEDILCELSATDDLHEMLSLIFSEKYKTKSKCCLL